MARKKAASTAPASTPHLVVSKPVSILQREVSADAGGLFRALGRSIAAIGTGRFWELAAAAGDAAAAVKLRADAGGRVWALLW